MPEFVGVNEQVGAVVDGVVRRVEEYGTFVGLSGTKVSGLLHVSNISRARVDSVQVCLAFLVFISSSAVSVMTCSAPSDLLLLSTGFMSVLRAQVLEERVRPC